MAFQKLDSNGDGFLDLEEIISQLPVEDADNVTTRRERLLEVDFKQVPEHVTELCRSMQTQRQDSEGLYYALT